MILLNKVFRVLGFCGLMFPALAGGDEFRYGILTDDYGIVTKQDLKKAAETAEPGPIIRGRSTTFTVWQCFPVVEMSIECIPHDSPDPLMNRRLILSVLNARHLLEFYERRPTDDENCRADLAQWRAILGREKFACISASYDQDFPVKRGSRLIRHTIWTIDRLKSRHGAWSYFIDNR